MRKFMSAALAVLFLFSGFVATANATGTQATSATPRVVVYPGQNPQSQQTNGQARFQRVQLGTHILNELGAAVGNGLYANLSAVPGSGMYVQVQPTQTGTIGSLYQQIADDASAVPAGTFSPQLSADSTKIVVQATQTGASPALGPMIAPASGTSQYYLIEAQIQQKDANAQSTLFFNASNGSPTYQTVNTQRIDVLTYNLVPGVAASSPTVPATDTGWIPVATVLVPSGVASITSGMISMISSSAFPGFVVNSPTVAVGALKINGLTAGCLQSDSSGNVTSQACTSGIGTVNGTNPITATTASGTVTVACPNCVTSVQAGSNITSSGGTNPTVAVTAAPSFTSVTSTNGMASGTSSYGPTSASINGPLSASSLTLATPLPVAQGGTGKTAPAFTFSTPLSGTGSFPNYTIACNSCVTGVTASGNLSSTGGTTPAISLTNSPTFTSVTTSGFILSGSGSGCLQSDASGNVSVATCASGGGLTAVNANSPLSATNAGGVGTVSLSGVVPVANGGTNISSLLGAKCIRSASTLAFAEAAGDCVTGVTASGNLSSTGGTTPAITESATPTYTTVTTTNLTLSGASAGCLQSNSSGVVTSPACPRAFHAKLAIGLGFATGTVATATVYPYQPVVGYTNGQITALRASCGTADGGTTVLTLYKNGTSVATFTLSTSQTSVTTLGTPITIAAGDLLHAAITTAGTGSNCGFVAEGQQDTF